MTDREKIVSIAQKYIGCKESDGSHRKIIDIYNSHKPLARGYAVKYTDAWCSTFASAVAIEAGLTDIIPTECGCGEHIKLFQKLGSWQENDAYVPKPGDYIFYDWDDSGSGDNRGSSDHVGIVEKVSGSTITVIEGNNSDSVKRRTIAVNGRYIRGYGVPKYSEKGDTSMGYTNSKLVSYTKISPNRSSPRNHAIDTITIHCIVGQCSVETLGSVFAPTSRQASSNYGVGVDGRIGMYVEEKDRSWCSSNAANDNRAVTIEVASDTTEPYAVNAKAYAALLDLVTDICKRNGIRKLVWSTNKSDRVNHRNGCNMTVHRDYANKSCPGKYLYDRHGEIAAEVNRRLGAAADTPAPTPAKQFKVGDIVNFAGGKHYASANAASGSTVKASRAKVTQTSNGRHPYHIRAVNDAGAFVSGVYGWVDADTVSAVSASFKSYQVKVSIKDLNIRKGPGTNYGTVRFIEPGAYTIIEEAAGPGATKWGKLKSGIGWISLDYCKKIGG